jgi:hypothetical protein
MTVFAFGVPRGGESCVRALLPTQRATAPLTTGITTLAMSATSTPLSTSARNATGSDPSSSPKSVRSVVTTRNATSQAASVVTSGASHGRTRKAVSTSPPVRVLAAVDQSVGVTLTPGDEHMPTPYVYDSS